MNASQWISVTDRLPENGEIVLIPGNIIASWSADAWWNEYSDSEYPIYNKPKYWMPLPLPPKENS